MDDQKGLRQRRDRRLGYVLIALALLMAAALAAYGIAIALHPGQVRVIAFAEVGNLKIDDPVLLNGVALGTVTQIQWKNGRVLVRVKMPKPPLLREGYRIDDIDAGFMGDRLIMIQNGPQDAGASGENDTLKGLSHPGISEVVGMSWKLHEAIDSFKTASSRLLHGAPGRPSLVDKVNGAVYAADSASASIAALVSRINTGMASTLDSIKTITQGLETISGSACAAAPLYLSRLDSRLTQFSRVAANCERTCDEWINVIDGLKASPAVSGQGQMQPLGEKIAALREAIARLERDIVQIKVHIKSW